MASGFAAAGINVVLTGPLLTPAIAYLARMFRADVGFALDGDGDGDRIMLVDHLGRVVDGDQILFILAGLQVLRTMVERGQNPAPNRSSASWPKAKTKHRFVQWLSRLPPVSER